MRAKYTTAVSCLARSERCPTLRATLARRVSIWRFHHAVSHGMLEFASFPRFFSTLFEFGIVWSLWRSTVGMRKECASYIDVRNIGMRYSYPQVGWLPNKNIE